MRAIHALDQRQACGICGHRGGKEYSFYSGEYTGMTDLAGGVAGIPVSWTDHYRILELKSHFICQKCFRKMLWQEYFWGKDFDGSKEHIPIPWSFSLSVGATFLALIMFFFSPKSVGILNILMFMLFLAAIVWLVFVVTSFSQILLAPWLEFGNKLVIKIEIARRSEGFSDERKAFFTPNQYKGLKRTL